MLYIEQLDPISILFTDTILEGGLHEPVKPTHRTAVELEPTKKILVMPMGP